MQSTQLLISFSTRPNNAILYRPAGQYVINISDEVLNFLTFLLIWLEIAVSIFNDVIQFAYLQFLSYQLILKMSWYAAINNIVAFEGLYA